MVCVGGGQREGEAIRLYWKPRERLRHAARREAVPPRKPRLAAWRYFHADDCSVNCIWRSLDIATTLM